MSKLSKAQYEGRKALVVAGLEVGRGNILGFKNEVFGFKEEAAEAEEEQESGSLPDGVFSAKRSLTASTVLGNDAMNWGQLPSRAEKSLNKQKSFTILLIQEFFSLFLKYFLKLERSSE